MQRKSMRVKGQSQQINQRRWQVGQKPRLLSDFELQSSPIFFNGGREVDRVPVLLVVGKLEGLWELL